MCGTVGGELATAFSAAGDAFWIGDASLAFGLAQLQISLTLSPLLLQRATTPFHLTVGPRVYTKREVSRLEAGLKSTGRRLGYAIQSRHTKDVLVKCLGESEQGPCKWQVRLIPGKGKDGEGNEVEGHTASEIDPVHQCEPKLPKPSEPLKRVLDYFVSLISMERSEKADERRNEVS